MSCAELPACRNLPAAKPIKKVLVTGGVGSIGGSAVDVLLAAGHDVAVIDNFFNGNRGTLNPAADPNAVKELAAKMQTLKQEVFVPPPTGRVRGLPPSG